MQALFSIFNVLNMNNLNIFDLFIGKELIIIFIILLLLVLVFLLLLYTFYLRIYYNIKNKYIHKKQSEWENTILEYISKDSGIDVFNINVKDKDFQIFGEFVENYLVDLKGDEYERIINFLKDIGYGEMLMKTLDKTNKWDKTYAAHFLGLMKYKQAESKLLKLVYDKSPIVYLNAFEALHQIGSQEKLSKIIKDILENKAISSTKIIEIILGYGDVINPILVELLEDSEIDSREKRLIVDILSFRRVIESSQTILKLAEKTDDIELKIGCIKALGTLGDPDNVFYLIKNLDSENWIIRSQSAKALGKIGSDIAISVLKNKLLSDENFWVKYYSAIALKQLQEKGLNALYDVLKIKLDKQLNDIVNYVLKEEEIGI